MASSLILRRSNSFPICGLVTASATSTILPDLNFEEALEKLANEWLEESVYIIEQKAGMLNMVALLFVAGVIAWAVMGTFQMQDQITNSMGG